MTEPSIDQRLILADEAKRLLGDPLFNGLLSALIKQYLADLMTTMPGSKEGLVAHAGLNALDDIKKRLKALENDGVMTRQKMEKDAARSR